MSTGGMLSPSRRYSADQGRLLMSDPSTGSGQDRLKGRKTLKVEGFLEEFEKDDIKKQVDIISLFTDFGIELTRKGRSHIGLCPFHDDHEPSLSVDREKGLFHCFGCGVSGDVIEAVKLLKKTDFRGAVSYLKSFNGKPVLSSSKMPERILSSQVKEEKTPVENNKIKPFDLESVAGYYHKHLLSSKKALDYLTGRGITDNTLYSRFRIGFCDGSLETVLSKTHKEELTKAGLITKNGTEHFKECIVVPVQDPTGRVTGFYGRKINETKPAHLYLSGGHKGLLNRKAFTVYPDEIILTESVIDALSLLQLGIQNVVPCYGVNGFTDLHLKELKDARTKNVVIAFDNDDAGKKGSGSLQDKLLSEGFQVKQIYPEESKDWNEFLVTGGTKQIVDELIKNAHISVQEKSTEDVLKAEKNGDRYQFTISGRIYRLIGVKQSFVSSLRVNIRFEHQDPSTSSGQSKKHIDNVDLYSARSRTGFAQSLSMLTGTETGRTEHDLILILEWLETERDKQFYTEDTISYEPTEEEKRIGFTFLTHPKLCDEIVKDMETLGYVGEPVNKILMYLAASSRKLTDPISVIVLSQSAAGKSYLIDTVKKLIPPEDVVSMTSLSDQALNYLPENGLLHKFLVMGEAVHGDIIEHQIREMLSAHELSRLVTMKDPKTGDLSSRTVRKEVIVSAVMSSTDHNINPENASRCFMVNTDESIEQTKNIHEQQRKKYSLDRYRKAEQEVPEIIRKHHAAQRLLTNRIMVNPFAEHLRFPDTLMRSRRDHERFIDLIACVCFLRQYQKEEMETEDGLKYIECDLEDYKTAYEIMIKILPSTLTNFPKSAAHLFDIFRTEIRKKAKEEQLPVTDVHISQRELRERTGLSHDVIKWNIRKLCEYEYVKITGFAGRGGRRRYSLASDEELNLIDISIIPSPEEMIENLKSGLAGVKRGNESGKSINSLTERN